MTPPELIALPRRRREGRCALGRSGVRLALVAVLTFLLLLPALALDFPALTGRVVDDANILDDATRAALTQKLADLEAKTTDQLVVVTLKSLQGTSRILGSSSAAAGGSGNRARTTECC